MREYDWDKTEQSDFEEKPEWRTRRVTRGVWYDGRPVTVTVFEPVKAEIELTECERAEARLIGY